MPATLTPDQCIEMAKGHRDADMLDKTRFEMQGHKSSSVGCFNYGLGNNPRHFGALSRSTGYPEWAHRLQEVIFENLPKRDAADWHVDFFEACAKVTDWDAHYSKVMIAILEIAKPLDTEDVVQPVIDLHRRDDVTQDEWAAARHAARHATWDTATLFNSHKFEVWQARVCSDASFAAHAAIKATAKGVSWAGDSFGVVFEGSVQDTVCIGSLPACRVISQAFLEAA